MGDDIIIRFLALDLVSGVADRVARNTERMAQRVGGAMVSTGRSWMQAGMALATTGAMIAGAAVGLGALAYNSIQASNQFRSDMVMVVTHAGLAKNAIDQVSNDLLAMAPAVGFGPDALAQAFYHVQSASTSLGPAFQSIQGKESLLYESAKLAAIGHANLTDTVNTMLGVLSAYHASMGSASDAAAMLNAIVGNGNVTMQQFDSAMRNGLLPVAVNAGLSLKSLGAAFGTLTDAGVGANQAATYLRSALIQMTMPTGPATKALQELGLAGKDVMTRMGAWSEVLDKAGVNQTAVAAELARTGSLSDVLNNMLMPALVRSGLTAQQAGALIGRAFGGVRSGTGIITLANNLQSLHEKELLIGGSTKEWAATWQYFQSQDPAFVVKQLQAGFDSLRIVLGQALTPAFLQVGNALGKFLQTAIKWVTVHKDLIGKIVPLAIALLGIVGVLMTLAGLFVAVTGAAMVWIGTIANIAGVVMGFGELLLGPVIGGVIEFATALITFGPEAILVFAGSLGPLGLLLLGLIGAFLAVTVIVRNWSSILHGASQFVSTFTAQMKKGSTIGFAFGEALMSIGVPLRVAMTLGNALNHTLAAAESLWKKVSHAVMDQVNGLVDVLQKDGLLTDAMIDLNDALAACWPVIQTYVLPALGMLAATIAILIGGSFQAIITALRFVIPGAIMFVAGVLQFLVGFVSFVSDLMTGRWDRLGNDLKNMAEGAWNAIKGLVITVLGGLIGFIVGFCAGIVGAFRNLYDILVGHSIIPDLVNEIVSWFEQLPGRVVGILTGMVGQVAGAAASIGTAIWNGITSKVAGLAAFVNSQLHFTGSVTVGAGYSGGASSGEGSFAAFATGGLVTRPTFALVGEAGPELIVPLKDINNGPSGAAYARRLDGGSGGGPDYGQMTYAVLVQILNELQKGGQQQGGGVDNGNLVDALLYALKSRSDQTRRLGLRAEFAR